MLITSHLLGTLILSKALSIETPELYVALLSGVGVDIDHIFMNQKWIRDIKDFTREKKITYGTKQHSWLQEILFGTVAGDLIGAAIAYFSASVRWWVFPLFLLLHILMDSVMHYQHWPLAPFGKYQYSGWLRSGTKYELLTSLVGLVIIFLL